MGSRLRRLAAEHAALRNPDLPPNWLFPPEDALGPSSDDLTQLTLLLTGPQGTPYSQGVWRVYLKLPDDYPNSPPKASFRTRIWHPNVEELTGAVCVDTLKRDWKPSLTLRDVLITISCLLIHPNPDSALNSAAGALLQEDYDAFARQAGLMTSIHAQIPEELRIAATEAQLRGEDKGAVIVGHPEAAISMRPRKKSKVQCLTMKTAVQTGAEAPKIAISADQPQPPDRDAEMDDGALHHNGDDDEDGDIAAASKENNPSLSPSPVHLVPPSPRKTNHGKRPLSELAAPMEFDSSVTDSKDVDMDGMTASDRNVAANQDCNHTRSTNTSPTRKSLKTSLLATTANTAFRTWTDVCIYEDIPALTDNASNDYLRHMSSGDGKENPTTMNIAAKGDSHINVEAKRSCSNLGPRSASPMPSSSPGVSSSTALSKPSSSSNVIMPLAASRKVSSTSSACSSAKPKPRLGVRRL